MIFNKKALEFSFSWMFAIIVGAVIIFLAVYASTEFIKTEKTKQDTVLGKQLGIILTPIETNLETGKITRISIPEETRIYNECKSSQGTFGTQKISLATKLLNDEWSKPGFPSAFNNKYIFSQDVIEGEEYFVFAKPFNMPFKIADLIYLWPSDEDFCFVNPLREIEDEISDLGISINITSLASECKKEAKKVCFTTSGCDIDISLDSSGNIKGSLKKKFADRVYFETSALLYAAIFSSTEVYECHLKRLMKRTSELSLLYYSKSLLLNPKGCSSNLEVDLSSYANKVFAFNSSLDLRELFFDAEIIRRKNEALSCKLF